MIGLALALLFIIAQGAAVFGTAWIGTRLIGTSSRLAKAAAMALSYVGWAAFTLAAYACFGGDAGFFDGFGLILFLCFTALISSLVYGLAWAFWPTPRAAPK
jgi:hypothetical protein